MTAARPTSFKGINFRSRLEARWAAFFDLVGWSWEYEPETEGRYIPDFLLHGSGSRAVFVEVKPLAIYQAERAEIIIKARDSIGTTPDLLILNDGIFAGEFDEAAIGYMPRANEDRSEGVFDPLAGDEIAVLIQLRGNPMNAIRAGDPYDFRHTWGSWEGRLSGHYDGNAGFQDVSFKEGLSLWSKAGNAIQWKPGQ